MVMFVFLRETTFGPDFDSWFQETKSLKIFVRTFSRPHIFNLTSVYFINCIDF